MLVSSAVDRPAAAPADLLAPAPRVPAALAEQPASRPLIGSLAPGPAGTAAGLTVPGGDASVLAQNVDQATLETRQPEVQWSPAGAVNWQAVPTRQDVRAGDRVRTGAGASARLVYFEGTVTEIGPETGLVVQRLERAPDGGLVGSLYQTVGTTVSRVVQLVDPGARFEVETPAATAFVRGTMPQVIVGADGVTQVNNIPDNTGGTVAVQGKDPDTTRVSLAPGQSTRIAPGQPPSPPAAISLALGAQPAIAGAEQETQGGVDRQQQRQQQQAQARQAVAQAQAGLVSAVAELARLTQQEQQLLQTVAALLAATPTPVSPGPTRTSSPTPTRPPASSTPVPVQSATAMPTVGASPTSTPSPSASPTSTPTTLPTTRGIFTTTTGAAPNRVFVIEWRVQHFANATNTASFEIQLEESTNRVFFVYGPSTDAGASATAGLQQATGAMALQLSFHQPVLANGRAVQFAQTAPPAPVPPGTAAPCPGPDAFGYTCTDVTRVFVSGTTDIGNHCDDCVTVGVPLPFPFTFYGQTFSQVNISSNGNIQFVSTSATFTETALPNAGFNQAIFVFWDDWETVGTTPDAAGRAAKP